MLWVCAKSYLVWAFDNWTGKITKAEIINIHLVHFNLVKDESPIANFIAAVTLCKVEI